MRGVTSRHAASPDLHAKANVGTIGRFVEQAHKCLRDRTKPDRRRQASCTEHTPLAPANAQLSCPGRGAARSDSGAVHRRAGTHLAPARKDGSRFCSAPHSASKTRVNALLRPALRPGRETGKFPLDNSRNIVHITPTSLNEGRQPVTPVDGAGCGACGCGFVSRAPGRPRNPALRALRPVCEELAIRPRSG